MRTVTFNVKRFDAIENGGIDIVFNTELTQDEIDQINPFLGDWLTSDSNKETPTQYYLSDMNWTNADIQTCITTLPAHAKTFALVFDTNLVFNDKPIPVYYAFGTGVNFDFSFDDDDEENEEDSDASWNMTAIRQDIYDQDPCLLTGFNYRLFDYLMSRGFNAYEDSQYEHDTMHDGIEQSQIVLATLQKESHYQFIENKELVDDES